MKVDNIKTRSKFETDTIRALKAAGVRFGYETMKLKYYPKASVYTPDIILDNGIVVELKGYFRAADRAKLLMVKKQHPDIDLRLVFMSSKNKLHSQSSTTYGQWCEKNGFLYSDKKIPAEWLAEKPR